jgi:hypothetical protein
MITVFKYLRHLSTLVIAVSLSSELTEINNIAIPIVKAMPSTSAQELSVADKQLFEATWNGDIEAAKSALANGANVNAAKSKNWTPLHSAAYKGHVELVKLFIQKGANLNVAAMYLKWTPLHYAAEKGHKEVAMTLLINSADTAILDLYRRSPSDCARHSARYVPPSIGDQYLSTAQLIDDFTTDTAVIRIMDKKFNGKKP